MAVAWSLFSVEAALLLTLKAGDNATLGRLIARALQSGLVVERFADQLDAGRKLRNSFSHATTQSIWTDGMVAPALETSNEVVAHVFEKRAHTD